jgi:hypothetical protein
MIKKKHWNIIEISFAKMSGDFSREVINICEHAKHTKHTKHTRHTRHSSHTKHTPPLFARSNSQHVQNQNNFSKHQVCPEQKLVRTTTERCTKSQPVHFARFYCFSNSSGHRQPMFQRPIPCLKLIKMENMEN